MKSKDLIAFLQKEDPSGEIEVVVGQSDIYFAERLPMYYDGCPIILIRDKSKEPYYDIKGFRATSEGEKIKLYCYDAEDVIWDNPDCIVELNSYTERHINQWINDTRIEAKKAK
jgi:hypothetical protein